MYDLAIIGGGPAGAAAAVYAARKQLKTVLLTETFGGQSTESAEIQNWIGTERIPGADLAKALEAHVRAYAGTVIDIKKNTRATRVEKGEQGFVIETTKEKLSARVVLIASGGTRKKLEIPGAEEYENKGVVYCASCDGPLFGDQDVIVVGGGNAAFETAAQLLAYAKSVTLINRSDMFKADPITVQKVLAHPNMRSYKNAVAKEIRGSKFVEAFVIVTPEGEAVIPATGVFVEIGMLPNTGMVNGVVEFDQIGRIKVNPKNQRSSVEGIWAAGDCTDGLFHQNNIAAGDAIKALEDIYLYVKA